MKGLYSKRKGAFAFEFIIVLVLFMAALMVAAPLIAKPMGQKTALMSHWVAGCDEDPAGVTDINVAGASYYDTHVQSRYCPRSGN